MFDMNAEVALIMTVGGIVGAILTTQMWQMNWFKRENFKIQRDAVKAENRIKLKKLETELGLRKTVNTPPAPSPVKSSSALGGLGSLAPLLKSMDGEQLKSLADMFLGEDEEIDEAPDGLSDVLLSFAENNPEVVKGLIDGFTQGKKAITGATQESASQV